MTTTQTPNLGLTKAVKGTAEPFSIDSINGNLDILDEAVGGLQESVSQSYTDFTITTTASGNAVTSLPSSKRIFGVMSIDNASIMYIPWSAGGSNWIFKTLDPATMQTLSNATVRFRIYHS